MGSKAPDYTAIFQQALNQANQHSPVEDAISGDALSTLNWARQGDYRNPPKNAFFSFEMPAMRKKRRDLMTNAGNLGVSALGSLGGGAEKLIKSNDDANFAQDEAANYQNNIASAFGNARQAGTDLAAMDQQRRMGVLSTTAGLASNAQNQPKWWQSLLGAI